MPHDITILTEADLRSCVALDLDAVKVVEDAFAALATGKVVMPPILSMAIPEAHGEVDVKTAYIPGFDGFAIKVSPGFFDNPRLGLPSLNGLMILFSATTGLVQALLLDNGYLTDIRTAAAGAVAARHLAPSTVETAGVLGTGVQARLQIKAAHLVRPFSRALVWGRDIEKAKAILDLVPAEKASDSAILAARAQIELAEASADAGDVGEFAAALERDPGDHQARFDLAMALVAKGDQQGAIDALLELFRRDREWNDGAARAQLFKLFDSLGPKSELAAKGRRRLSSMIFA